MDAMFPPYNSQERTIRIETEPQAGSGGSIQLDPFDTSLLGHGIPNYALDPKFAPKSDYPPLATQDELDALNKFYDDNPSLHKQTIQELAAHNARIRSALKGKGKVMVVSDESDVSRSVFYEGKGLENGYDPNAAWIQTHSGRRFNPTKPNPDAIVIQDIAHALSMQCRFSGHCREFYSVAQHSVLVSYICDHKDAMWGLLHDASEAYLVDVPRPLKRSGLIQGYIEMEERMQEAICRRFALPFTEPPSVKEADTVLLATEARDLMSPLHSDWQQPRDPLPFKIEPWDHNKAKDMFMKRFFELFAGSSAKLHYEHYLKYRDVP